MSAVDIFVEPSRAIVFTDAAVYDIDGLLLDLVDKATISADGKVVVTGRGNAWFPAAIAKTLGQYGMSIDDIEDDAGEFFETCFRHGEALMERAGKSLNNVWAVGWSERDGKPKVAEWSNCPPAGVPRFRMVDSVMAPDMSAEGYAKVQRAMGPMQRATADLDRVGLEVMKAQRFEVGSAEFGAGGQYLVGGHIQRTEVSAVGIVKQIVHTWPEDQIGEKIRPRPELDPVAHANVTFLASMNRAERRRLEKAQRKGAA